MRAEFEDKREGRGMSGGTNFAYLDEGTKRMIRRPCSSGGGAGYQVPFASREMPMP